MNKCSCNEEPQGVKENSCCCSDEKTSCNCGRLQVASTRISAMDLFGTCKARLGIGRMDYKIEPGLYKVNNCDSTSPILVSANYKLTFDTLRKNLADLDCWLLILDTKGINVWCAAGKGTFGTEELINRIEKTGLAELVTHRKLILPQLGASGVSAPEIFKRTGFSVMYGPVRATDIKAYISAGMKATKEMRAVRFNLWDRFVLTPMELVEAAKIMLPVFGALFIINLFTKRQFGIFDTVLYVGANFAGAFITPILLPIIPGRAFSFKGWIVGLFWTAFAFWLFGWYERDFWLLVAGYGFLLPAVSSFLAMNFTGASTYTSPSGVLKEMKIALPFIIGFSLIGVVLILIKSFMGLEVL